MPLQIRFSEQFIGRNSKWKSIKSSRKCPCLMCRCTGVITIRRRIKQEKTVRVSYKNLWRNRRTNKGTEVLLIAGWIAPVFRRRIERPCRSCTSRRKRARNLIMRVRKWRILSYDRLRCFTQSSSRSKMKQTEYIIVRTFMSRRRHCWAIQLLSSKKWKSRMCPTWMCISMQRCLPGTWRATGKVRWSHGIAVGNRSKRYSTTGPRCRKSIGRAWARWSRICRGIICISCQLRICRSKLSRG